MILLDILRIAPRQHAEALARDVRYAARGLRRAPGFAVTAIVTIALGTGATSAVFAVVNAVLIRPLPYTDPSRVALVWARPPDGGRTWLSPPELDDINARATTLERVAGLTDLHVNLTEDGAAEELKVIGASPSLFTLLGTHPSLGRLLEDADDKVGARNVVVLSYELWRRRFGGSAGVLGSLIRLDGRPYAVVGVLPPSFGILPASSVFPARVDAWVPLQPHLIGRGRDLRYLHAISRVRRNATFDSASRELAAIGAALSREFGSPGGRAWTFDVVPMQADVVRTVRPALMVLSAAVAIVLLIACANVAALLLARGESRRRELAIRSALGASRARVVRQLLTEGAVLAVLGAAAGLGLAAATPALAASPALVALPRFSEISLDWRVLLFAVGIAFATALVFALAPALEVSIGVSRAAPLFGASRSPRTIAGGRVLAGVEIALASMVLVMALMLARTFAALVNVDPGFETSGVITARLSLPPKYARPEDATRFVDLLLDRLRAQPGVESAGAVTQLPLSGEMLGSSFLSSSPAAPDAIRTDADLRGVTPDYFRTMKIPLLEGRSFSSAETVASPPVAIVDETMARRLSARGSAVGQRIRWIRRPEESIEVIGVVRAVRHRGFDQPTVETVYRPHTQYVRWMMSVVVAPRDQGVDAADLARGLVASVRAIDPDQPIADLATLESLSRRSLAQPAFGAALAGALALLALALAAVGAYGIFAFAVAQRTRELGVRLAIGAAPSEITRLVLAEGAAVAGAGLIGGLSAATLVTSWVRSWVPGAAPADLLTFGTAAGVMLGAALVACWLPARRAGRLDPASVLRLE